MAFKLYGIHTHAHFSDRDFERLVILVIISVSILGGAEKSWLSVHLSDCK